jgi:16S rRNA processing protein RimM
MIKKENVFEIGHLIKPHGIKGELTFSFTTDVFDEKDCPFLILELEGILVPFFIENYRLKNNNTGLIKFENIDSEKQAQELSNAPIYLPNEYYQEEEQETSIHFFIGFDIIDHSSGNLVGKITDVDDSTVNTLFIVNHNEQELLIPAVEEFIYSIDEKKRLIYMNLPLGLIDMTLAEDE